VGFAAGSAVALGSQETKVPRPQWHDQVVFRSAEISTAENPYWFEQMKKGGVTALWLAAPLDEAGVRSLHGQGLYEVVDASTAELARACLVSADVDGVFVGSVKDLPLSFWTAMSSLPYADPPGVLAEAKSRGKPGFLVLGDAGPTVPSLASSLNAPELKDLSTVLNGPLSQALDQVLAQQGATRILTRCLVDEQNQLADPTLLFNALDSNSGDSFLKHVPAPLVSLAVALLFTVPGVPVLGSPGTNLDDWGQTLPLAKQFAGLRLLEPELSRGQFTPVADRESPGTFAFMRTLGTRIALVVINTSDRTRVMFNAPTNIPEKTILTRLYGYRDSLSLDAAQWAGTRRYASLKVGKGGTLTEVLAPYSVQIWVTDAVKDSTLSPAQPLWGLQLAKSSAAAGSLTVSGVLPQSLDQPSLLIDDDLDHPVLLTPDSNLSWSAVLPTAQWTPGNHTLRVIGKDSKGTMVLSQTLQTGLPQDSRP